MRRAIRRMLLLLLAASCLLLTACHVISDQRITRSGSFPGMGGGMRGGTPQREWPRPDGGGRTDQNQAPDGGGGQARREAPGGSTGQNP
ncbi:hypothetical protein [Paenibacillus glufosinatiresistens]|uniref:hypothetical protein n=1 Tax=Paenibacillus glufosinatiresistens TaxID=3070657 RepID=UPI00286E49A2|nr:hypothetical protein [Paenibacillus sp. YX.27]